MRSAAQAKRRYHASAAGRLIIGPTLTRLRGDVRGQRVLAIGCGRFELAELRDAGARERVGVDRSPEALAAARAADPDAQTIVADMDALDPDQLGVKRFDLVQIVMALQYSMQPEVLLRAAFRALRPSGRLVIIVPHPCSWGDELEKLDATGRQRRSLGYESVEGPNGTESIRVIGSYLKERLVTWRNAGIEFMLRPPSQVYQLLVDAGFTVTAFEEPGPRDDLDDADLEAIAKFQGITVDAVRRFFARTSNLPDGAAFLAVRPGGSARSQAPHSQHGQ